MPMATTSTPRSWPSAAVRTTPSCPCGASRPSSRTCSDVVERLEAHAQRLGLDLESALVIDPGSAATRPMRRLPSVPAPVLAALARAGAEALTNVAKHAGVSHATLLVRHDRGGVQVFVADEGVGTGGATDGFGVSRSIRERMESVGGEAMTGPGPEGRGTVVLLEWHRRAAGGSRAGIGPAPGNGAHRPDGGDLPGRDGQRPDRPGVARLLRSRGWPWPEPWPRWLSRPWPRSGRAGAAGRPQPGPGRLRHLRPRRGRGPARRPLLRLAARRGSHARCTGAR